MLRSVYFNSSDAAATTRSRFGELQPVTFMLDDVQCSGSESSLLECSHTGIGLHNCKANERAGVRCQGKISKLVIHIGGSQTSIKEA